MITPRSFRSLRFVSACIILVFILGCLLALRHISREETKADEDYKRRQAHLKESQKAHDDAEPLIVEKLSPVGNRTGNRSLDHNRLSIPKLEDNRAGIQAPALDLKSVGGFTWPSYNFHAFYYPWYGNPKFDGKYLHWNHQRLPHWDPKIGRKFSQEKHVPPDDIGASFYPELGCYSSRDPQVIEVHMQQLRTAGIGVLVLSWYPPNKSDEAGFPSDDLVPALLNACHKYDIKLVFHSEPYKNRTELTFLKDLQYIHDTYGAHPALYRHRHQGRDLPLIYLYDSYLTSSRSWARIFKKNSPLSIRGTKYDAVIVGLYVEQKHNNDMLVGGFDGFYTYFTANKFSFGSRWTNWKFLAEYARRHSMLFIPSIGPGYDDTQVRPWNSMNTHPRRGGEYYKEAFAAAMDQAPPIVSITSFNEWHEGTQIERAIPKPSRVVRYYDYLPNDQDHYLTLTRQMVEQYHTKR